MATFSAGYRASAGSTTLPFLSIYATAVTSPRLKRIEVFNTTVTAIEFKLVRLTTIGTRGTAITTVSWDEKSAAGVVTASQAHSVAPTAADTGFYWVLGAAIGSGVIDTFDEPGLTVPLGTTNGFGLMVASGTGQVTQASMTWEE